MKIRVTARAHLFEERNNNTLSAATKLKMSGRCL